MANVDYVEQHGTRTLQEELFWKVIYAWRHRSHWERLWRKYGVSL